MNYSKIWVTRTTNIHLNQVKDESKIETMILDADNEKLRFFNTKKKEHRKDVLKNVSIYDDLLVVLNIDYKILRMLTKPFDYALRKSYTHSSQVKEINYDPFSNEMTVEFIKGDNIYTYKNVGPDVWQMALDTDSIGSFMHQKINSKYQFVKIPK